MADQLPGSSKRVGLIPTSFLQVAHLICPWKQTCRWVWSRMKMVKTASADARRRLGEGAA